MELRGPYDLEHLLIVANTLHGREAHNPPTADGEELHDHLRTPEEALEFFRRQGLPHPKEELTEAHLSRLRTIRHAVRQLAEHGDPKAFRRQAENMLAEHGYDLAWDGSLRPQPAGWEGLLAGLLIPMVQLPELLDRLKACQNHGCRWLFLDRSRNQSRRWCDMSACGNRVKVRRYRRRHPHS